MKYRKKPVVIDAWRISFDMATRPMWVDRAFVDNVIDWCSAGEGLYIDTLEGHMRCSMGDWLIRGVKSELYACKPDIFEATYELAE